MKKIVQLDSVRKKKQKQPPQQTTGVAITTSWQEWFQAIGIKGWIVIVVVLVFGWHFFSGLLGW
ncbi:hypothetical protein [Chrysiogenes arsenatis]|uniref:hypothetical protein n=1 Tax=Chrysiogenes arsenatis TaxID=309797 RepID=UPI000421095F|nr:hypothetical protein [Chrysiogenes arsenatis]